MLIWLKNQGKVRYRTFQLRSEEDDMDVPIDLGLPPMMVVAEEPPAAVPAVVRRDDVEVHDL